MTPEDVSVLIPAAGEGERLGRGPKALLVLCGRTVLDWVVDKARLLGSEILIAAPSGLVPPPGCQCIPGGATRQESVAALSQAATRPWVLVWDAARPFGSVALAQAVLLAASEKGAAAALEPSGQPQPYQTPLAFDRLLLQQVVAQARREGWQEPSTMALVLRAGCEAAAVPGEDTNLKLTTPRDWVRAQTLAHLLPPQPQVWPVPRASK